MILKLSSRVITHYIAYTLHNPFMHSVFPFTNVHTKKKSSNNSIELTVRVTRLISISLPHLTVIQTSFNEAIGPKIVIHPFSHYISFFLGLKRINMYSSCHCQHYTVIVIFSLLLCYW